MKKAVWLLEAGLFFILSIPLAILPARFSTKAGETLGLLLFYIWGSRRRIAIGNLKASVSGGALHISEPAEKIIRDNFRNLGKSFTEVIKIYYGLGKGIINSVEIEGVEHVLAARGKAKEYYS